MQREVIFEKLKETLSLIKPSTDFSTINEDSQLVRDVGLDSLTIMLLSLGIEKEFGFQFDGSPKFNTVGEVMDYIDSHTTS